MIKKEARVILIILLIFILFILSTFFGFFSYFLNNFTGKVVVPDNSSTTCGNGICESGEGSLNCEKDCLVAPECGNGICDPDETSVTCPQDCSEPIGNTECGNGICDSPEEDFISCPADCEEGGGQGSGLYCGDGICTPGDENSEICPQDCDVPAGDTECGNSYCESGETSISCPIDCENPPISECGDIHCEFDETPITCPQDCEYIAFSICENGYCEFDETPTDCPDDCLNILQPLSVCGYFYCEFDETPITCPQDCFFQTNQMQNQQICLDTDNGINYEKKGIVSYEGNYPDLCIDKILEEYYCTEQGHLGIEHYSCPNGCSDGACVPENGLLSPTSPGCTGTDCSKEMSLFEKIINFFKRFFT